jgi:hypothetical protein
MMLTIAQFILTLFLIANAAAAQAHLPSWTEGPTKQAIVTFVERVTKEGSPDFVPVSDRIATFDNDGTLWVEQPMYVQVMFLADRLKALAPQHPEWQTKEPFAAFLKGDLKGVAAAGEVGVAELMAATHSGMTTDEFSRLVSDWIATAKHPTTNKLYTEMVYQPMLELLNYLRSHAFKTFIVSGGGIEFMRPWSERVYGIPPEQVIGTTGGLKYELLTESPTILKLPVLVLNDDKEGKPVGIQRHIGRRPIAAFGNSDGDFQMLEWTTSGAGPRLGVIVHHDDAGREWAYDRESKIGRLERGLDEGPRRGWTIVSMKRDWKQMFPFDGKPAGGGSRALQ